MRRSRFLTSALALASTGISASPPTATAPLDALLFYAPSTLTPATFSATRAAVNALPSLNAGLWAAANSTRAEAPFIFPPHPAGMEIIVNTSAAPACTSGAANLSSAGGVATLPTGGDAVALGKVFGLSFAECVSWCCSTAACAAVAFYETDDEGLLCQGYTAAFATGPQPFPAAHLRFAQGAALATAPAAEDDVANGLRSGTWLGGLGTGGYELRADGRAHLSTIRNQHPAGEPWEGTLRDFVLAVALDGVAHAVALQPVGGLSPVPQLVYAGAFPAAKFSFLNVSLYAYAPLTPGDSDASNVPAVLFTLHVANAGAAPLNATLLVAHGLGLRSNWRQAAPGAAPEAGARNASACAAACAAAATAAPQPCRAWEFDAAAAACSLDAGGAYALGGNAAGVDSGHPGAFTVGGASVSFSTAPPAGAPPAARGHSALGAQGLFALPGSAPGSGALSVGAGAAGSLDALLALLAATPDAAAALRALPAPAPGDLFGAAAASVSALAPGDGAALTVAHAWHYPVNNWYRDGFGGSDVGVRYAARFADVAAVAAALNASAAARTLAAWQAVYAGLPHALLRDAAANLFAHARSAVWLRSGEFRQWESLEFIDFGNPTNGDERHLPMFAAAPDTMRSQLLTWTRHAQNADGSYYCIILSAAGDKQYGNGDPCAHAPPHPDDVTMVLVAAYEQLVLRNDSALIAAIYPSLTAAFGFYAAAYNTSRLRLPYQVHETYDAVLTQPGVYGEGNAGTSLFNTVQYLVGLHCMQGLAESQGDAAAAAAAAGMIAAAQRAAQRNLWQPNATFYVGDTGARYEYFLTEPSGRVYHSSDGLHGQVLAYRLGFGDLLPRLQMQLHQKYVVGDLNSSYGLAFCTFSAQNWLMSDHANAALQLHWNEVGAWDTALRQLRFFRDERRDASRQPAVVSTATGAFGLLNYYGYSLFFYHTLHGFTGQQAHLPRRALSFSPHYSAFAAGAATLPVVLGGALGTLALTPAAATLTLLFADASAPAGGGALSFLNITICQHVFLAPPAAPFALAAGAPPLVFALPAPCASADAAAASTVLSAPLCGVVARAADATTAFVDAPLPPPLARNTSLPECEAAAVAHRFCGYVWEELAGALGACALVPGVVCAWAPGAPQPRARALGRVGCDFAAVGYAPAQDVGTAHWVVVANASFAGGFAPLDSAVYSLTLRAAAACRAQAQAQQACGWQWAEAWAGAPLGGCVRGAPCCILNPYKGCAAAAGSGEVGIFNNSGVF